MIRVHTARLAYITVSAIPIPPDSASEFGLLKVDDAGRIVEFQEKPKGDALETMRVDTGCIVSMADTVDYDIQFVGGFRNALFGGEGLFYATLTGPGHIVLQTLPFSRLANRIAAAVGSHRDESKGLGGIAGGIIGDLISGD